MNVEHCEVTANKDNRPEDPRGSEDPFFTISLRKLSRAQERGNRSPDASDW